MENILPQPTTWLFAGALTLVFFALFIFGKWRKRNRSRVTSRKRDEGSKEEVEEENGGYDQTDRMVSRNRAGRFLVTIITPPLAVSLGYITGRFVFEWFILSEFLGGVIGLIGGTWVAVWVAVRSLISNDAVTAFVTIDPVRSLFNIGSALVTYGPGKHFCYFWEQRVRGNTVNLEEVAQDYETNLVVLNGELTVKYSARFRPDIRKLPEFLAGISSSAADLGDLISAKIVSFLSDKEVQDALKGMKELNDMLLKEFQHGGTQATEITRFEKRMGVRVGDVTAGELIPSKEIRETLGALTESEVIDQMVASTLGYASTEDLWEGIRKGETTRDEFKSIRTQAMAMSGNLQGMELGDKTYTFQVRGLEDVDPNLVKALESIGPAVAAAFGKNRGGSTTNGSKS